MDEASIKAFFKPEVQTAAQEYLTERLVHLTTQSDTAVDGYLKVSGLPKVSLRSSGIESSRLTADCSCSSSLKGNLCKHVFAVVLMTLQKYPDFLANKSEVVKSDCNTIKNARSPFKLKQAEFKKKQYEQKKTREKAFRAQKKRLQQNQKQKQNISPEVATSLEFFAGHGFEFDLPLQEAALKEAKKTLAKVLHPDKGGSHAEVLELNHHFEILLSHSF